MKFPSFIDPGGSQEPPAIAPGVAVRASMEIIRMLGIVSDKGLLDSLLDDDFSYGFNETASVACNKLARLTDELDKISDQIYGLQEPLMRYGAKIFAEEALRSLTEDGLTFSESEDALVIEVTLQELEGPTVQFDLLNNLRHYYKEVPEDRKRAAAVLRRIADDLEK